MNFYGINSHSGFDIRMHYEEPGLFIIIGSGYQSWLYCSPKTRCKIACLCATSIKMGFFLLQSAVLHSWKEQDHSLSFFFHLNKAIFPKAPLGKQTCCWLSADPRESLKCHWGLWPNVLPNAEWAPTLRQVSWEFSQTSPPRMEMLQPH